MTIRRETKPSFVGEFRESNPNISSNSSILIKNVGINETRLGFLHIAKMMGANIDVHNKRMEGYESLADINVKTSSLQSIQIEDSDLVSLSIDEFPAIFILQKAKFTL